MGNGEWGTVEIGSPGRVSEVVEQFFGIRVSGCGDCTMAEKFPALKWPVCKACEVECTYKVY